MSGQSVRPSVSLVPAAHGCHEYALAATALEGPASSSSSARRAKRFDCRAVWGGGVVCAMRSAAASKPGRHRGRRRYQAQARSKKRLLCQQQRPAKSARRARTMVLLWCVWSWPLDSCLGRFVCWIGGTASSKGSVANARTRTDWCCCLLGVDGETDAGSARRQPALLLLLLLLPVGLWMGKGKERSVESSGLVRLHRLTA